MLGATLGKPFLERAGSGSEDATWSIGSGELPPGLALNPQNGLVTGTPTVAGKFSFTVEIRLKSGGSVALPIALEVSGFGPQLHRGR